MLFKIASWFVDILVGILILLVLYLVLIIVRSVWSRTHGGKWRLEAITDTSNTGAADLIVESLCNWGSDSSTLSSGLLRLERLQLPSVEWLKPNSLTLDLSDVLKDFSFQLAGGVVSLKGLAGAGKGMKTWFNATCPAIRGKVTAQGANLLVSLTARSANGNVVAVTESRTKKSSAPASGAGLLAVGGIDSSMTASSFPAEDIQSAAQSQNVLSNL